MAAFVLDRNAKPLMPCTEKRARLLLVRRRARVHRVVPFTIRIIDRDIRTSDVQPLRIKLDPGSRVTGIALVRDFAFSDGLRGAAVLNLFDLIHRGAQISKMLTVRRAMRRARRCRKTRYRAARLNNRRRSAGWLAPSLRHRLETTIAWVHRLRRFAPVVASSTELVRFDMQAMENPAIRGVEYQQGTLAGYELREYLLEKWGRQCAYCDATGRPLQIDHIKARALGGSNRVSNLTLACKSCNQQKDSLPLTTFLRYDSRRPERILAHARAPLRDAAAVNMTRWALFGALKATGLQVEPSTGGRTKFNRAHLSVPKTHALDAACVGEVDMLRYWRRPTLAIRCTGRGAYRRTRLTASGFPRGYLMRQKRACGFQTGDLVRAKVPRGKKTGTYVGRVAIRASGSFNIQCAAQVIQGISHRYCTVMQRGDGYGYSFVAQFAKESENWDDATRRALSLPA
ncbi:RNA-guided endonuclease IscB [Paraburkholderia sp. RL18-085-BIA-A]|uniref:RNA-guided endonuclease IscB n=1 Tax=Paraburkholderia sp. RL18-085-BIA-A TaxID=3031633 RepID=UPI0038B73E35